MSFHHRFVQGLGVEKRTHPPHLLGRILLVIATLALGTQAAQADVYTCAGGSLPQGSQASPPDLVVTGECRVAIVEDHPGWKYEDLWGKGRRG